MTAHTSVARVEKLKGLKVEKFLPMQLSDISTFQLSNYISQ